MDTYEYTELLKALDGKIDNAKNIIKPDFIQKRLQEIKHSEQDPTDLLSGKAKHCRT
jgi:peptide chain release factor 2